MGAQLDVSEEMWRAGDPEEEFMGEDDAEEEELVERRAVCVFDFAAECEGEISIEIGQVVWVEFRKGVSGWLVVKDEITGNSKNMKERWLNLDNKGLVPEGYVRFLNGDEERQYLAQSPPSNTLLPRDPIPSTGEDTPRQTQLSPSKQRWNVHPPDEGEWVDEPEDTSKTGWEAEDTSKTGWEPEDTSKSGWEAEDTSKSGWEVG